MHIMTTVAGEKLLKSRTSRAFASLSCASITSGKLQIYVATRVSCGGDRLNCNQCRWQPLTMTTFLYN